MRDRFIRSATMHTVFLRSIASAAFCAVFMLFLPGTQYSAQAAEAVVCPILTIDYPQGVVASKVHYDITRSGKVDYSPYTQAEIKGHDDCAAKAQIDRTRILLPLPQAYRVGVITWQIAVTICSGNGMYIYKNALSIKKDTMVVMSASAKRSNGKACTI